MRLIIACLLLPATFGVGTLPPDDPPATIPKRGEPETISHQHGSFVRYVPQGPLQGTLVLVHGSLAEDDDAIPTARAYLNRWVALADKERFVLLAPAFDQENFGGVAGPGGGYRGLFGRDVGADTFVNAIVDETCSALPELPEKFALYGHSAGGQFVSRYLVVHPERVDAAVISAAGTFAFPDPQVPWPNGMGRLHRRIRWDDQEPWKEFTFTPDADNWLKASQILTVVVVGACDTDEVKAIPGNPGQNHIERASAWVQAMGDLARRHDIESSVRFVEVPGIGHDSARLTPACQQALLNCLNVHNGPQDNPVDGG